MTLAAISLCIVTAAVLAVAFFARAALVGDAKPATDDEAQQRFDDAVLRMLERSHHPHP